MNLANRLTVGRLVLTLLFVLALGSQFKFARTSGLGIFVLAGVSDYLDGEIARRSGTITKFGKLMDPLADKVLIAAAFISLVPLDAVPAWAATVVVARDFLITGLRLLAASEGTILPAEKLGKHKTSWQIATVVYFLVLLSISEIRSDVTTLTWWQDAWHWGGDVMLWITVALTIYSGLGYLWQHRALLGREEAA